MRVILRLKRNRHYSFSIILHFYKSLRDIGTKRKDMKIGVDLGGTNIRAGLVDDHSIVNMNSSLLQNKNNLESTLEQLKSIIHSVRDDTISGIGIGVPSVIDLERGIVDYVVNIPSWKDVPLRDILEKEFNVPVFINNDVNCFVLGEKYYGFGKNHKTFVGVALGTGIGSGVLINNELYNGVNCGSGEIGYLPYLEHDFEYYCSSNFFEKEHNTSGAQAYLEAKQGDQKAMSIWAEFGHHVGIALKSVVYAFDPEAIILGGSISTAYPFFKEQVELSLKDSYFPKSMDKLKIYVSEVEYIAVLGAAAQVDQHQEIVMN